MKQKGFAIIIAIMISGMLTVNVSATPTDYNSVILPGSAANTLVTWEVVKSPDVPFSLFWTGSDFWFAENGSLVTLNITAVDNDVRGILSLGNVTVNSTNTNIAKDLALGVWGATEWWPGLVTKVGQTNIAELNTTAYASAERVYLNFLNGSMTSDYQTLTVNERTYECIVFEYEQDPTGFGEPQKTLLAYDLDTGVLVKANTSYSFGVPYILELELQQIVPPSPIGIPFVAYAILALVVIGIVGGVILFLGKR